MSDENLLMELTELECATIGTAAAMSGRTANQWLRDAIRAQLMLYDRVGGQPASFDEPVILVQRLS